jgi:phosphate-selective porin OprO/OprP
MKSTKLKTIHTILAAALLGLPLLNAADESGMKDTYDRIWGAATLYSNKENSFIQKLAFTGRLQYDYAYFDEDQAGHWDDTTWRRARAGFKAQVLNNFTVHAEINMDPENTDPVYDGITDAYIGWKSGADWGIKVGKQSAGFTHDGATSSKKLVTIERSVLSDNFWFTREYFVGASISGERESWSYNVGVFGNEASDEFEDFGEEGYFFLASIGNDFAGSLGVDTALLRLDFVYNDESDSLGTKSLETVVSLNGHYDNGRYHMAADLTFAESFSGNDLWGIQLTPYIDITDTFQVVASFNYLSSSDDNGLSNGRYQKKLVSGKGDRLQDFYIGLNTYLYGHKLKWQNGIQWTEMKDSANDGGEYDGIGFTSAIRLYW